ncbi:uncharacterized protein LOC135929914 [Gordionus sp. m RMFG-2023]|uniref:uncharacterized protein LOC135929914 n=1 Tax=Gordionus sp. m RMFG-2023 TaxID=3053472 RepID=UPI0031FD0EFD
MENFQLFDKDLSIGESLFLNSYMSDVRFEVEKEIIHAHTFILSFKSQMFHTMFHGSLKLKDNCVKVEDLRKGVFKIILKYIYTNEVCNINSIDIDSLLELLYGAKKYMLKNLIDMCIEEINVSRCYYIDSEIALKVYLATAIHPEINIFSYFSILLRNESFVFDSDAFLNAPIHIIKKFIESLPNGRSTSNLYISEFLIKFAKNKCCKCQIPDDSKNDLCKLSHKKSPLLEFDLVDMIQLVRRQTLLEDTEILNIVLKC